MRNLIINECNLRLNIIMSDSIILTDEILEKGKSKNGAWSMDQLNQLGVFELKKGWKKRIIGQNFKQESIKKFLDLKDKHLDKNDFKLPTKIHRDSLSAVNQDYPIKEQYNHPEWLSLRKKILKRDNNTCKICGKTDTVLQVHHLLYPKNKFVWQIEEEFLITICLKCHEIIHI